ncbi:MULTISPECIES: phage protein NinX family protein [Enterobacterales]|uniref:phage protein NinX family protein n=1 Tax=Enterobacterales TaxID=91347 RepID=UPI002ED9100A
MKIYELTGSALDFAVDRVVNGKKYGEEFSVIRAAGDGFRPSSSWRVGGPLIERYRLDLMPDPESTEWWADKAEGAEARHLHGNGPSPLIAACRAIASTLGDEVDIPFNLIKSKGGAA